MVYQQGIKWSYFYVPGLGTFTPLANELKKLNQKYFHKRKITTSQVDNLLIALTKI